MGICLSRSLTLLLSRITVCLNRPPSFLISCKNSNMPNTVVSFFLCQVKLIPLYNINQQVAEPLSSHMMTSLAPSERWGSESFRECGGEADFISDCIIGFRLSIGAAVVVFFIFAFLSTTCDGTSLEP